MAKVVVNKTRWNQIKRNLRSKKAEVQIGWFEGQMHDGRSDTPIPMAQIAQWVEEGQRWQNQPARPAIRQYFIPLVADSLDLQGVLMRDIAKVADGKMSWSTLHQKLGTKLVPVMQHVLQEYKVVANKPSTVKKKGFNDPWVETGALIAAVKFKVGDYKLYPSRNYKAGTVRWN